MTRGEPRVQYPRTYVLLPPGANAAWAHAVVLACWDSKRYTVGGSADDAGVGNLDARNVIAVNPDRWPAGLFDFFTEHYPGVEVSGIYADTPGQLERILSLPDPVPEDPILLCQRDPRWAEIRYGGGACLTIGAQGCWLACCAMAQRQYGIDEDATPLTVDEAVGPDGYTRCEMRWDAMPRIGLRVARSTTDLSEVDTHLTAGGIAFADVLPGPDKHFVLVTWRRCSEYEGGRFWMYDPLQCVAGWLDEHCAGVESWRLITRAESSETMLVGLHDEGGGRWMVENGMRGVCLVHEVVQAHPRLLDYRHLQDAGITVICRLGWGYADGTGTMPRPKHLAAHLVALADTMCQSLGVDYWHPWNEPNNRQEFPSFNSPDEFALTKEYVADAFNSLIAEIPESIKIALPPLDPYFGPGDDNMLWWEYFLANASRMDAIILHGGKTQDNNPASVWSTAKFSDDPLRWQYLNARSIEPYIREIPAKYQYLPVFCTEVNPQRRSDGTLGWDRDNAEWVREAVAYLRRVGQRLAKQSIAGAAFYRYDEAGDQAGFGLCNQPVILEEIGGVVDG